MSTAHVHQLGEYRGRRDQRLRRTLALYSADESRAGVLHHLWQALCLVGGERAAAVWVDEYGPGIPHVYAVLDLLTDSPRRSYPVDLLTLTWQSGVPGIVDVPDVQRSGTVPIHDSIRSACVTSLGSDGMRAWFLVVDATHPRASLEPGSLERMMFLSGECAGIVLHRDLDRAGGEEKRRFPGWSVLQDMEDSDVDEELNRRIAGRFLITRAVRQLLDDDLAVERESRLEQIRGIRSELGHDLVGDPERDVWERILQALEDDDHQDLAGAILALGVLAENQGHFRGAEELHAIAFGLARHVGAAEVAVDAARFLGRVTRRGARWDEALHWYGVAREVARTADEPGRHALVLDGMAAVYIGRGALPRAREILEEAVTWAVRSGDRLAMASVHHNLMTVEHTAGRLQEAASFGWRAVQEAPDETTRLAALVGLGGVFLEGRELGAAEDAFAIVAARTSLQHYRLYALSGYAQVAAMEGDRNEFERRVALLEKSGFAQSSPEFRAEALLERGDCFLHLHDPEEARRWYSKAAGIAERHGVNEYLVRAEEAVARLDRVEVEQQQPETSAASGLAPSRELDEIRGGLGRIRQALPVGAGL